MMETSWLAGFHAAVEGRIKSPDQMLAAAEQYADAGLEAYRELSKAFK